MKLIYANISGFKRFEKQAKIDLENKLIAIVGPNEVGKTSILNAFYHIEHHSPFGNEGEVQEITRGLNLSDEHRVVKVSYCLEKEDKSNLAHLNLESPINWLHLSKAVDGQTYYNLEPEPKFDTSKRRKLASDLEQIMSRSGFIKIVKQDSDLEELTLNTQKVLQSQKDILSKNDFDRITSLKKTLSSLHSGNSPKYLQTFIQNITEFLDYESSKDPSEEAYTILKESRPEFLFFSDSDRTLKSYYAIDPDPNKQPFPSALINLAQLGKLNLESLRDALNSNDRPKVETLIQNANNLLKEIFEVTWSQSGVTVHLDINGRALHIFVNNNVDGNQEFTSIVERSEGLRHFVALIAFVHKQGNQNPILLMDEVENHLHYDAQADLVQMFAKQQIASKIIYTTHSIGCLPEDLGSGVRLVEESKSGNRSRINNWFWVNTGTGFYPLLFGMGAKMMAFIPLRYSVITEGPTDMLLLPSLLKEAINQDHLGFQIVPGISISDNEQIAILDRESKRTVYLVDSDLGGQKLQKKLLNSGIHKEQIFNISNNTSLALTIEDFIDSEVFCKAVELEVSRWQDTEFHISSNDLPITDRINFINKSLRGKGLKEISKRSLASNILENRNGQTILSSKRKTMLQELAANLQNKLNIS